MSKFKIGDRVKQAPCKDHTNILQHWNDWWASKNGSSDGTFYITRDIGDNFYGYSNKIGGEGPMVSADYLELVEETPMPTPEYSCIRVVPPSKPKREIVASSTFFDKEASVFVEPYLINKEFVRISTSEAPFFNAKALREAAALFTTLAEVLEENAK